MMKMMNDKDMIILAIGDLMFFSWWCKCNLNMMATTCHMQCVTNAMQCWVKFNYIQQLILLWSEFKRIPACNRNVTCSVHWPADKLQRRKHSIDLGIQAYRHRSTQGRPSLMVDKTWRKYTLTMHQPAQDRLQPKLQTKSLSSSLSHQVIVHGFGHAVKQKCKDCIVGNGENTHSDKSHNWPKCNDMITHEIHVSPLVHNCFFSALANWIVFAVPDLIGASAKSEIISKQFHYIHIDMKINIALLFRFCYVIYVPSCEIYNFENVYLDLHDVIVVVADHKEWHLVAFRQVSAYDFRQVSSYEVWTFHGWNTAIFELELNLYTISATLPESCLLQQRPGNRTACCCWRGCCWMSWCCSSSRCRYCISCNNRWAKFSLAKNEKPKNSNCLGVHSITCLLDHGSTRLGPCAQNEGRTLHRTYLPVEAQWLENWKSLAQKCLSWCQPSIITIIPAVLKNQQLTIAMKLNLQNRKNVWEVPSKIKRIDCIAVEKDWGKQNWNRKQKISWPA